MKHLLYGAVALIALIAVACGGGDKKAEPEPTARAESTTAVPTEPDAEPTEEVSAGTRGGDGIGTLFNSVFSSGLSGGGGAAAGLGGGDEALKQYLPTDAELPSDFTSMGAMTFSAPASSSEFGAMDMAMTMGVKGDPAALASGQPDFSSMEMLVAMVIRPEDLQQLGEAFEGVEDLSAEEIQEQIDANLGGEFSGLQVTRFEVLDASGLGDGGFGMEMTIDMSGFAEVFGGLAGAGAPELGAMTMRMYMFGQGDHMGAVMRIGFSETLDGADEDLEIAEIISSKMPA